MALHQDGRCFADQFCEAPHGKSIQARFIPRRILKLYDLDSLQAALGRFLRVQCAVEAQSRPDILTPNQFGIEGIEVVPYRYVVRDPIHVRTRVRCR
jgi:hypothetical protein